MPLAGMPAHRRKGKRGIVVQGGLDAGAVTALEQRLESLNGTLDGNKLSEKARKNAIKYHKV